MRRPLQWQTTECNYIIWFYRYDVFEMITILFYLDFAGKNFRQKIFKSKNLKQKLRHHVVEAEAIQTFHIAFASMIGSNQLTTVRLSITVHVCSHTNYKIWHNQTAKRTFAVIEIPSFNTKKNYYKLKMGWHSIHFLYVRKTHPLFFRYV